jgi:hypothetical protein
MEKQNKTWRKKARNLVGALVLGASSILRAEDFSYGPITNDVSLVPIEVKEYSVDVSSTQGGNVSGITNNWYSEGTTGSVTAVANEDYNFVGWSGLPSGYATNNPACNLSVTNPLSIYASFTPKVTTNGIPHTWLTQYGITNKTDSVETQNNDGDSMNNLEEYIADTNPTNKNSRFVIGLTASGNQIVLGITPSSTGRVYGVESKTNLLDSTWNSVTNGVYGNGTNLNFNLNMDADRKFYRARVGLPQ